MGNDIKKINSTYFGDNTIEIDLLAKSLRIDKLSKSKSERDNALVSLGLAALIFSINQYKSQHKIRFPDYNNMKNFFESQNIEVMSQSSTLIKQTEK